jgi:hypothetical protein
MAEVEIVMSLLAALVVLLFLCWVSLRAIGSKLDSLFYTIHGFMRYSEQQNGIAEKKRMQMEAMAEKSFTEWQPEDSKDPN